MPERYRFRGTAIGASGSVTVPFNDIIEVQAATALPEIGGYGTAKSVDFRYRDLLRFDLAHSEVVGSQCNCDDGEPVFSTRVKATVEGLNIMDMVTVDRIVANLVSTYKEEGQTESSFTLVGSRLENLRIAGIPIKVVLAVDVLDKYDTYTSLRKAYGTDERVRDLFGDASLRERFHEAPPKVAQWFSHPVAVHPEMPEIKGVSRVSLVRKLDPDGSGLDCWGHVIHVKGFGIIRLGEVSIGESDRSLTMLQVDTNCPIKSRFRCLAVEQGGTAGRP